ncbi:zinc-finger homeodomain protein 9-like [Impatiens glandulifera]|uniref:zinc-finger homeodomain protein 9-like n=1 Tax=Impatiens glandulifera TaxID=253017 RepID=UPI001FB16BB2|nr:zinc-finger homeodomain protein 9-like [Impatiens glandulifera]
MEITTAPNPITNVKTPDPETETPAGRTQTNGVLKRLNPNRPNPPPPPPPFTYKECLKNHAATLGGHALDGCGEFMPSPNADPNNPTSLICAACGCHRNFHRRDPEDRVPSPPPSSSVHHMIEYQPHHRHHPPPPPPLSRLSPNSPSPPPISSSYYPSAPHMLLALSSGVNAHPDINNRSGSNSGSRKRVRTKFTQNQKDKMQEFADKVGWKFQKSDQELISEFCNDLGVDRTVLKVWMHNNKSTIGKKESGAGGVDINTAIIGQYHHNVIAANGSSSSLPLIESMAK